MAKGIPRRFKFSNNSTVPSAIEKLSSSRHNRWYSYSFSSVYRFISSFVSLLSNKYFMISLFSLPWILWCFSSSDKEMPYFLRKISQAMLCNWVSHNKVPLKSNMTLFLLINSFSIYQFDKCLVSILNYLISLAILHFQHKINSIRVILYILIGAKHYVKYTWASTKR